MKYWEAQIKGKTFKAPTLKALAIQLGIKPTQIEGVYYRRRLEDLIKIRKVVIDHEKEIFRQDLSGCFCVKFD
jgi:hypothetical protein